MLNSYYEEIKPANNPQEMRAEIFRHRFHTPLVRSVLDMADYQGLSAEDKYTILAYHALKKAQELEKLCFTFNEITIKPIIIQVPNEPNPDK